MNSANNGNERERRFVSGEPIPDSPGTDPDRDDQLGRSSFAMNLARAIVRITPSEGLVIALHGPWGSGKSTVLKFVETYLARTKDTASPVVINFNPWWFSRQDDLILAFFEQLLLQLKRGYPIEKRAKAALRWSRPVFNSFVNGSADLSIWMRLALIIANGWPIKTAASFPDLKKTIEKQLEAAANKILVIIDDIDRLTADQVRQVFRLVKSVADFPNITYLLAFDRDAVCRMLQPEQGGTGEEYLGKIVQIPFELPAPDSASLHQMVFRRLDAILAATPDELFDRSRWMDMFSRGLRHLLRTPRDVIRLTNALALSYGSIRDEADAVDFVAIEALRVFLPKVYDVIRRNLEMFCDLSWRSFSMTSGADLKKFHDSWFDAFCADDSIAKDQRESVREMLTILFPRLETFWRHALLARNSGKRIASKRRICDPDVFPIFFSLSVPETSISRGELIALLSLSDAELEDRFRSLSSERRPDRISRARAVLEVLPEFADTLVPDRAIALIRALVGVGDVLLKADRFQGHIIPAQELLFAGSLKAALQRIQAADRGAVLATAIRDSAAVGAVALTAYFLAREHEKSGASDDREGDPLITQEEVNQLAQIALQKIREAAISGKLVDTPDLPVVLSNWQRWTSAEEVGDWIREVSQHPEAFARMLEGMLSEATVNGRPVLRMDSEILRPFVDPSLLIENVMRLSRETSLSGTQQAAVDGFIRAYNARAEGRKPDDD